MKSTTSENDFIHGFPDSYKDNFSYYGKIALYNYLEEFEEGTGEQIEFDPIAICCEYSEHENALECAKNYGEFDENEDEDEEEEDKKKRALEFLRDHTQVIEFNEDNKFMKGRTSGIIIQDF